MEQPQDILGIKPIARATEKLVDKSLDGIASFLSIVCKPVLEELGGLLHDNVRVWRLSNVQNIIEKAKGKLEFDGKTLQMKASPRVALRIIEQGSTIDNEEVQELWAGLFASSCSEDGQDDANLIFVTILNQLTTAQVKILKYSVENSEKHLHANGFVTSGELTCNSETLLAISGVSDIHRLDRELDYLRSLNLIGSPLSGGFTYGDKELIANIKPTDLSLNLYVKAQGFNGSCAEYWKDVVITPEQRLKNEEIKKDEMYRSVFENLKDWKDNRGE